MTNVVEYGQRRLLIVLGVMMAALLQTLDATIVNVALPTIEGNVGASIDDGTWIITGYIISNVVVIPLAPYLMQRLGRKQYYAICIAGFTFASFLCGTAGTLGALIFYRVVQGMFGGGLIATSQVILRDTFPPEKLGVSSGIFALALTVGPALGPTLGGFLTDNFSWQWVFDINIVPGAIALFIVLTMLRNPAGPKKLPFDSVGVALLAVGLGSMQYVLDEGERNDWFGDGRIVFATAMAVLGIAAFIYWELRGTKTPIVDLLIFRYRVVQLGVPCAIMIGVVLFGPIVVLPQYVQEVLGFTTIMSGFLILSRALPVILLTPFFGRFVHKVWPPILLFVGMALSAVSLAMIASRMTTDSDFGSFQLYLVLSGIGQSMCLVPLLVTMLGSVQPADSPKVSSFIALSVQLGGSIASALLIAIFDRRMYFHADIYRGLATMANPEVHRLLAQGATVAKLQAAIALQAMNAGFADSIYAIVPVAVVAALVVLGFRFARTAEAASK
ncbi:MAG TPA: DHA2 family efflux MFS transporter permease subunit [Candidatus Tumulicola sp.]